MGGGICERDGILRFRVVLEHGSVDAFLSHAACQADAGRAGANVNLSDFYRRHRRSLEQIVADKVGAGARRPVILRAHDLRPFATAA